MRITLPNPPNLFTERMKMHERYLADLHAVLAQEGQEGLYAELLAGIRPDGPFDSPSFEDYMSVIRRLDAMGVVQGLGLKLGSRKRNSTFGLFGIGFLTQASLWEMSTFAHEAFSHCWGHCLDLKVYRAEEFLVSRYEGRPPALASDPLLVEQVIMTGIRIVNEELPGQDWSRCHASLAYPAPPHWELYAHFLPLEVHFDQPHTELLIPWTWATQPMPMANDNVRFFCESSFRAMVDGRPGRTVLQCRILDLLAEVADGRLPDLPAVSKRLAMTERSIQAALTREGTSFRRLQNEVLLDRAKQLLSNPSTSVKEIAFALGFAQATNFSRAFAKATGMSPEQFRSFRVF